MNPLKDQAEKAKALVNPEALRIAEAQYKPMIIQYMQESGCSARDAYYVLRAGLVKELTYTLAMVGYAANSVNEDLK